MIRFGSNPPSPEDAALLARTAAWPGLELAGLTAERLAALAATEGIEFATALFFLRAQEQAVRAGFAGTDAPGEPPADGIDLIAVVPGAFHGQHKHTGADGLRIVELVQGLAPRVEVIPIRSFGRLEENAAMLLDWLEARRESRILLASLSKGGADVKWALHSPRAAAAFARVQSWVSFSGIVQGTPLMAWLNARPLRSAAFRLLLRLQGHQAGVLDEIARQPAGPLTAWPALPPHLRIVHVCGCPLRRHLAHRWAPRGYERLAALGPNDGGGILLGDLATIPGTLVPLWGADHYLQPAWNITPQLRRIVAATAAAGAVRHASPCTSAPSAAPAARSTA